jgi:hypothetical protein
VFVCDGERESACVRVCVYVREREREDAKALNLRHNPFKKYVDVHALIYKE